MGAHGKFKSFKNGPALAVHGVEAVRDAMVGIIMELPAHHRRSLTGARGAEMAQHARLRMDNGPDVYFCDSQSPWQRGSNENTNGLLRQYFPMEMDLSQHGTEELIAVANALNTRPRKTLVWQAPDEARDRLLKTDMIAGVMTIC
jgi:IS30 family transposase